VRLFEILTYIGAVLALLMLATAFGVSSAPQEAAAAAIGLCFVAIPYCVAGTLQRREMLNRTKAAKPAKAKAEFEPLDF